MGSAMREPEPDRPKLNPLIEQQLGEILGGKLGNQSDDKASSNTGTPPSQQMPATGYREEINDILAQADDWFSGPASLDAPDNKQVSQVAPPEEQGELRRFFARQQQNPEAPKVDEYGRPVFPLPLGLRMIFRVLKANRQGWEDRSISISDDPYQPEICTILIKDSNPPTFYARPQPGEESSPTTRIGKVTDALLQRLTKDKALQQRLREQLSTLASTRNIDSEGKEIFRSPEDKIKAAECIDEIAKVLGSLYSSDIANADKRSKLEHARQEEQISLSFRPTS